MALAIPICAEFSSFNILITGSISALEPIVSVLAIVTLKSSLIVIAVASAFSELPEPAAFAVWNIISPPAPVPLP